MRFFTKHAIYYKENMRLALPVILSQMGQITVQLADTAMVGHYGGDNPTPLAAVSFATSIFFIVFIATMGLSFGLTPLVGEHFAQGNKRHTKSLLHNGLVLFTLIGGASALLLVAMRPLLYKLGFMMMSGEDENTINEIISIALPYYDTIIWSIFPFMIWGSIKQFLEGLGNTRIAMMTIIVANTINVILNWIFIFGEFGIKPMGAVGAGYATLISRIVQCILMLSYFFFTPRFREYTSHLFSRTSLQLRTMLDIIKVGTPISFQMLMEASCFALAGIWVLAFGAASTSAYQIGCNMMNVTFMIVVAIGSATTILCSHIYGRRNFGRLRRTVNAAYQMGLLWNFSVAICFVIFRYQIPSLFTSNQEAIDICATMLIFIAMFQVSDCVQAISISVMRGLQDVKVIMPIVLVSYVMITIPACYLLAFHTSLQANGLIIGFIIGLTICASLTLWRVRGNMIRFEREIL